ncbi:MAG TPA: hypothetical protein VLQ93_10965, partial [Myxococcaceae bacterium]|nr:hypothetical protein [Myxococcaceae bacterium]
MALLSTSCASMPPPPGRGMHLPRGAAALALTGGTSDAHSRVLASPPDTPERLHRRRGAREDVTVAGPVRAVEAAEGEVATVDSERLRDTHQAVFVAWLEVSNAARRSSAELSRLEDGMSRLH